MKKLWVDPRIQNAEEHTQEKEFSVKLSMTNHPVSIDNTIDENLALIGTKRLNRVNQPPLVEGYLFLSEAEQKLYYSSITFDKPEYLCDWDSALSGEEPCESYQVHITPDGDLIFLKSREMSNPIIYPAGDYSNPILIDFGAERKPFGFITDASVDHHPTDDYFVFADYLSHSESMNDEPLYIWKVSKPYDNPANWVKVDTWYHRHFNSGEGTNPAREVGHFHTTRYDFYADQWVVTSGDNTEHCRVITSPDGDTWTDVANDTQQLRMIGLVFTADGAYWGTDQSTIHYLYKAPRQSGIPQYDSLIQLSPLAFPSGGANRQPTYTTCLMREPYGLLFLDRAEPRPDHKLDLEFWSFEDEKLYHLGVFNRMPDEPDANNLNRHGWGNQAVTQYQSEYQKGIVCGSNSVTRRMSLDVLNNTIDKRVGNLQIEIVRD